MKAVFLTSFLTCMFIFSCKKTAVVIKTSDLNGTWKLARVTGSIAGIDTAPTDRITITFETNSNYSSTLNTIITSAGKYTITKATEPNYYGSETLLNLCSDVSDITYGMHLSTDSLFLSESCCDMFNYIYVRLK